MAAQGLQVFAAGYESVSGTIAYTLYELAINPEIQKHLRNELQNCIERHGGEISHECINDMKYLDMCIKGWY